MPQREKNTSIKSFPEQDSFAVRDNTKTRFTGSVGFTPPVNKHVFDSKDVDYTDNPLGYMPIVGDVLQAGQAVKDAMDKRWGKAAVNAGLVFLPNALEGPIKATVNGVETLLRRPLSSSKYLVNNSGALPYKGRNFLHHGISADYVGDVMGGETRAITPSYAINRPSDFNNIHKSPVQYGEFSFIGDKGLLDDALIYHGDGMTPDMFEVWGSLESIPPELRQAKAEQLWEKAVEQSRNGNRRLLSASDLDSAELTGTDRYFEAVRHGLVPLDESVHGVFPIPESTINPGFTYKVINEYDKRGLPITLYDERLTPGHYMTNNKLLPYNGYSDWHEKMLDVITGPAEGALFKSGGKIHIKPSKRGTFTAAAKKHGKSVQAFASQVLAHKENYSPAMVKKANFARNFGGHRHEDGGFLQEYPDGGRIRGRRSGKFFVTELGDNRERKFQDWYANAASVLGLDPNPDAYEHAYDYRGYWLNNRDADVSAEDFHFPDTWKQPHHPTFSDESIYAKGREGVGHWEGDTFVPGPFNNLMRSNEPTAVVESESPVSYGSNYTPSDEIIKYIKDTEAFRDKWYQDGNGIWTIGYGFTGDDVRKRYPNGMTRAEADQYFADTVGRRIPMFIQATPNFDRLNQNQRDALFSYYYNIGHGGYTRKSPTMQKALKDFDLDTVKANIDFGYNDKKNSGLRKRRDYERNLFATPMDYGGILNRLKAVYGDTESIKAAILRAKNAKKTP